MIDPITDLGIYLRREIPKGEARMKWLRTDKGFSEACNGLRAMGYDDLYLARAIFDLTYGEIRMPLKFRNARDLDKALGL